MKLIVDIGNSYCKIAVFDNKTIVKIFILKNISLDAISDVVDRYNVESSIISSVIRNSKKINTFLNKKSLFIELNKNTPIPLVNLYKTQDTLGKDRLAAAVGAHSLFPKDNVLVIDAGTCIKYDLKNSKNEYYGGAISPGVSMRFQSLNNFTAMLPLCKPDKTNKLTGATTKESIISGVINGVISEVDCMIDKFRIQYGPLKIILSGGDANYFDKKLKNSIFAVPNIVLLGLNEILDYNVK
jgi:type III pantothenate kinase